MRLCLVGAFPFPAPRGSQRYALEQARALRAAGADVTLACYGRGDGRALSEPSLLRTPARLGPGPLGSPLAPAKAAADAALVAALVRAHRAQPFDALLAHNAEAALVAFAARRWLERAPVVYVAHTLWREELASYLPRRLRPALGHAAARLGGALDARCASRADGVIALSPRAARALGPHARGPLAWIPPGLAPEPAPEPSAVATACRRRGLADRHYAVYIGNLDAYQDLDLLDRAAARLPEIPFVAVTHDATAPRYRALRVVRADPAEARALAFGARVALLPRRHAGGFPLKLLGYLEASVPVVAFADSAPTLAHGDSGWLLPDRAGDGELAEAVATLWKDGALAARLAAGGRRTLEAEHAWPALARRTLALARAASAPDPLEGRAHGVAQ